MDNGQRRTDERVDAMSKSMKLPDDTPFYYVSMPTPSLIATDVQSMGVLMDEIYSLRSRLVVIDNLGLVTGTVEENSAEMARVMKNFRWIAEETGAAFLILHHQRKGGANGSRAGDALRGHSSIEASLDLALHAVREANTNQVTMRSTKTRGVDVPNAVMEFNYSHIADTNDLDNAYFTSVQVRHSDLLLKQVLISFAEGHPNGIPKNKLREMVYDDLAGEFSHGKIRAEMEHLIEVTGELTLIEGKQGAKLITIGKQNGA
jgi:RecA-family ATPase